MIRIVVFALAVALLTATDAGAQANADYDVFDGVAWDNDQVWTSPMTVSKSFTYDSASFTEGEDYTNPIGRAGCTGVWGAKTAWIRFSTAASGRLALDINSRTDPYDVFYNVYDEPLSDSAPGAAQIGQIEGVNCLNERKGSPDEAYAFQGGEVIKAGTTVYVQVLSVCANRVGLPECSAMERATSKGGPTTVSLTFDPDDSDNDQVPNGVDKCKDTPGVVGGMPNNGCPDDDKDGVTEPGDACEDVQGFRGDGCRKDDHDGDGAAAKDRGGNDCNDNDDTRFPANPEKPGNDHDENCDNKDYFDEDKDSDPRDCDDDNPEVKHGAKEIVGNKVNEDCKNGFARFPALSNEIDSVSLVELQHPTRRLGFSRFLVEDAQAGLTVRVSCQGISKVDCPYQTKMFKTNKQRAKFYVGSEFAQKNGDTRELSEGTKVTVALFLPGYRGTATRFEFRKRGRPRETQFCAEEGSRNLQKTCSGVS